SASTTTGQCWCVRINTSRGARLTVVMGPVRSPARSPPSARPDRRRHTRALITHSQNGGQAMNLGLEGRRAIICASSRGLGKAWALALAQEGVAVVINGRDIERLEATATELRRETGAEVIAVAADLCREDGRARLVAACPAPDILVTNNGGPAPGRFEDWDRE